MRKLIPSGLVLASGLLVALQASPVHAQETVAMLTSSSRNGPVEKAAELERKAELLYAQPARYVQAARLLTRAAELRTIDDPLHVSNLSMASRLLFYAGNKAEAFELMEQAANAALAAGDVLSAAHAFVDASHLAAQNGRATDVTRLAERARLLTSSPLLADSDRSDLRGRLKSARS